MSDALVPRSVELGAAVADSAVDPGAAVDPVPTGIGIGGGDVLCFMHWIIASKEVLIDFKSSSPPAGILLFFLPVAASIVG